VTQLPTPLPRSTLMISIVHKGKGDDDIQHRIRSKAGLFDNLCHEAIRQQDLWSTTNKTYSCRSSPYASSFAEIATATSSGCLGWCYLISHTSTWDTTTYLQFMRVRSHHPRIRLIMYDIHQFRPFSTLHLPAPDFEPGCHTPISLNLLHGQIEPLHGFQEAWSISSVRCEGFSDSITYRLCHNWSWSWRVATGWGSGKLGRCG
jgi:hypothetical protein